MRIVNNRLVAQSKGVKIDFKQSPNVGGTYKPSYLIIHYTAGASKNSSVNWFLNPKAKASAHIVIGMDGSITQMADFNVKTWHAGVSRWFNLIGMNNYAIGIELDNPGKLRKIGDKWTSYFGKVYPSSNVIIAKHKHQEVEAGWHYYTEAQMSSLFELSTLLVEHYNLKDILGHEDVSPFRKEDPGPAFPLDSFKSKILGRMDAIGDVMVTKQANTNFRSIPQTANNIPLASLSAGVKVEVVKVEKDWAYVYIVSNVTKLREKYGWIHISLLK
jgi:N-acetylmuramoyl-L-alanine amidase